MEENGDIILDQIRYVNQLEEIPKKNEENDTKLSTSELKELRGKNVNKIASEVPGATVKTSKDMNKIIKKAKDRE